MRAQEGGDIGRMIRVKSEEEFLKQLFGDVYLDYMTNTKRFLLF